MYRRLMYRRSYLQSHEERKNAPKFISKVSGRQTPDKPY